MLIHLRIRDKRYGSGFYSKFFHENDITPEIYKFVKNKADKIISIDFGGVYYWGSNPLSNTSKFLNDYKHLDK